MPPAPPRGRGGGPGHRPVHDPRDDAPPTSVISLLCCIRRRTRRSTHCRPRPRRTSPDYHTAPDLELVYPSMTDVPPERNGVERNGCPPQGRFGSMPCPSLRRMWEPERMSSIPCSPGSPGSPALPVGGRASQGLPGTLVLDAQTGFTPRALGSCPLHPLQSSQDRIGVSFRGSA